MHLSLMDSGDDVVNLENRLYELGFFDGSDTDRIFTSAVEEAVKAWQRWAGRSDTGICTDDDWAALNSPGGHGGAAAGGGSTAGHDGGGVADPGVTMDDASATELAHKVVEGAHGLETVAEATAILAQLTPFAEAAEVVLVVCEPLGAVLTIVLIFAGAYDALDTQAIMDSELGQCYGAMYTAMGWGDPAPIEWGYQVGFGVDEARTAWHEGLAKGRQAVSTPKAKNAILLACARHGEQAVVNGLWKHVTEGRQEHAYTLHWPDVMYGM